MFIFEQAIGAMVSVPGASNTVLDASVPYAASATRDLLGGLGHEPKSLCSEETAGKLAKRAYCRAAELSVPGEPIIGVACTAALKTVCSHPRLT
jgi:nicotinamide mononucleotide (NMN) deamidase PncC